jgi:DNA-binding transcriptional ArsR family regulator
MRDFMDITKALSDQNRVRVLMALRHGELCVCQITAMLELAPSTVSKHIAVLKNARLVDWRKNGLWMHYKLPDDPSDAVRGALEWLFASLSDNPSVLEDQIRLDRILKMNVEELCRRQNGKACRCSKQG